MINYYHYIDVQGAHSGRTRGGVNPCLMGLARSKMCTIMALGLSGGTVCTWFTTLRRGLSQSDRQCWCCSALVLPCDVVSAVCC